MQPAGKAPTARSLDTKPQNAYLERPATLGLLSDVDGKHVLDAGCGPGVYTEWLVERGADVVGIDVSRRMVEAKPTERFRAADPEEYERLSRRPSFLCIRARV